MPRQILPWTGFLNATVGQLHFPPDHHKMCSDRSQTVTQFPKRCGLGSMYEPRVCAWLEHMKTDLLSNCAQWILVAEVSVLTNQFADQIVWFRGRSLSSLDLPHSAKRSQEKNASLSIGKNAVGFVDIERSARRSDSFCYRAVSSFIIFDENRDIVLQNNVESRDLQRLQLHRQIYSRHGFSLHLRCSIFKWQRLFPLCCGVKVLFIVFQSLIANQERFEE